jgi:RNA polymerase sigma factor (sigma-70 family)
LQRWATTLNPTVIASASGVMGMFPRKKEREKVPTHREELVEVDDNELIRRICESDHNALEILYKRYYQRILRFSYRMTRRLDQVEEIINDVMMVVWNKASTFNHEAKVSTWILGIAYKKCLKSISERNQYEHVDLDEVEELIPGVQDHGMTTVELDDWLVVALGKLPADQRAVLELTYHQGMSYKEIAVVMDCPENTVKTRMFHARKKVQSMMPDLLESNHFENFGGSL